MDGKEFLQKVQDHAKANNKSLFGQDRNTGHKNFMEAEKAMERLYGRPVDPYGVDGVYGPSRSVDKERNRKVNDAIVSGNLRGLFGASKCNRDETYFALTGRERPQGPTEEPAVKLHFSFSKQIERQQYSMADLIRDYLSARALPDTEENRATAMKFFADRATKRGMIEMVPELLKMDDATYQTYLRLIA